MAKFQKGNVVRLKSGGPDMTVKHSVEPDGASDQAAAYICTWFINLELMTEEFDEALLVRAPKRIVRS